jgi:hypothetical protein
VSPSTDCLQCHAAQPTADRPLCTTCTAHLHTWLVELAGHAVDLEEVVVTRLTSRRGERVQVRGSTEPPQQWNENASTALEELRSDLKAAVNDILGSGVRETLANTVPAMALFAARHVDVLALRPDALATFDVIRHRHGETVRAVDIPPNRVWLGRCDAVVDGVTCGQDVRAAEGATAVRCKGCMSVLDVGEFRARMLERSRDGAVPFPELVLIFRGVVRPNLLAVWRNRGRLRPVDPDDAEPLYRIGEVMDMVEALRARKENEAA